MYALMVVIILLLKSKEVKVNTMMFSIKWSTDDIKRNAVLVGVRIDRSDIARHRDVLENGLTDGRCEIYLNSYYPVDYKLVLTENGGRVFLRFCSADDGSGMGIVRFNLRDVWTDTGDDGTCDVVRLYGEDVFFIQLIAGGPFRSSTERSTLKEIVKG